MRVYALQKLNSLVDRFWAEISESISKIGAFARNSVDCGAAGVAPARPRMAAVRDALERYAEVLYEDASFSYRTLAALVASKVYYHLGAYEEALNFALGAGDLLDLSGASERGSEYIDTIVSHCIAKYIQQRVQIAQELMDSHGPRVAPAAADAGAASTARPDAHGTAKAGLADAADAAMEPVSMDPRLEAIVCRMLQHCIATGAHKQAIGVALEARRLDILVQIVEASSDPHALLTYAQNAVLKFETQRKFRHQTLALLQQLYRNLPTPDYVSAFQCLMHIGNADQAAALLRRLATEQRPLAYQLAFDLFESASQQFLARLREQLPQPPADAPADDRGAPCFEKLHAILSGSVTTSLHMEFLHRTNRTDLLLLKTTINAVARSHSIFHTASVISHALMQAGTCVDTYIHENSEWLARATYWAKFSATAGIGVIHKGHTKEAMTLLSRYLPTDSVSESPYSEGGSLFALGLIHANQGSEVVEYFMRQLTVPNRSEIVLHGACLGLGLSAMASHRQEVYQAIANVLHTDSAVAGEAAGIAMGMVMLGSHDTQAFIEMTGYARETQHEKIMRGLALGIALLFYACEEQADGYIEQLAADKDPQLRCTAMLTVAAAYCGTDNNGAIRRLLHVAVSDANDDVRRTAVMALGFVLARSPDQCPPIVALLAESYNPYTRYGAAFALGISCAGTGSADAIALLERLCQDSVDYVRQAAMIAMAMVLIQQSDAQTPKAAAARKLFEKVIADRHEDILARFGAIIAQGLIEAGGRNVTIAVQSRTGHIRMPAVVGLLGFVQMWHWYPLCHLISLAFVPTALIALADDLKMPKMEFRCDCKPSLFAYPPNTAPPKDEKKEKVSTAILSITHKAKVKAAKKAAEGGAPATEAMQVDAAAPPVRVLAAGSVAFPTALLLQAPRGRRS